MLCWDTHPSLIYKMPQGMLEFTFIGAKVQEAGHWVPFQEQVRMSGHINPAKKVGFSDTTKNINGELNPWPGHISSNRG